MFSRNTTRLRRVLNAVTLIGVLVLFYYAFLMNNTTNHDYTNSKNDQTERTTASDGSESHQYNVWLIFTKIKDRSPLRYKFVNLLNNVINVSSLPLTLNIVVDNSSADIAVSEITAISSRINKTIRYTLYDINQAAKTINDIVSVMTPRFSSRPGTYYSDALFYLSIGLYRIAPRDQKIAVMLDCDLYFKRDIAVLFKEFSSFKKTALFGLAPELTPVYRHILHMYKTKHNTTFGEYYGSKNVSKEQHPKGFQGYNSGVILFNLTAIRESEEYSNLLTNSTIEKLTKKYRFRGHLGDQDFYTLIGFEYPHLIQTLNCGFNRQLCVWWRDHGYKDVFDNYFRCKHPTVILHGNCNTKIPK